MSSYLALRESAHQYKHLKLQLDQHGVLHGGERKKTVQTALKFWQVRFFDPLLGHLREFFKNKDLDFSPELEAIFEIKDFKIKEFRKNSVLL